PEGSGSQRELPRLRLDVPALDRRAPRAVIVEVPRVLVVVIAPVVSDRADADLEPVGELQVELRPDLQPEPIDVGPDVEVIDPVKAVERVPSEDELRFLVWRGKELRPLPPTLGRLSQRCGGEECGKEVDGGGPPQSKIQNLKSKIG